VDDAVNPPGGERREVFAILACKGRRARSGRVHRPEYLYVHTDPWPLPPGWNLRVPHSTLELVCDRCGYAPRPGDAQLREWIEKAAGKPGRILYIDGP
jgi:hypothetical protein